MRWEEIWDASLRIRNLFNRTPIPAEVERRIRQPIIEKFGEHPVAVRSSGITTEDLVRALHDPLYRPPKTRNRVGTKRRSEVDARQLLGQPAGHGIATGTARVVTDPQKLFAVKKGEILVCDAIDPAMTFVAPLVAAIVERRGGMLIHGAIIAREYGLPCVTGIPEATVRIKTGDRLTVDGYLGIVVLDQRTSRKSTGAPSKS